MFLILFYIEVKRYWFCFLKVQVPRPVMVLNLPPSDCHATPLDCRVIGEVDQKDVYCCHLQVFCGMHW